MSAILYGVKRICAHLNRNGLNECESDKLTVRQVGYMIERGLLPTFKLGVIHCTTPDMLAAHFAALHGGSCHHTGTAGED